MGHLLDLLLGFTYIHIALVAAGIGVAASLLSLFTWIGRGKPLHALPGAFIVIFVPATVVQIVPIPDGLLVPIALIAAGIACYLHLRHIRRGEGGILDKLLAGVLALAIAAVILSFILGSLKSAKP